MSRLNPINIDLIDSVPTLSSMVVANNILEGEFSPEKLRKKNRHIRDMIKKNLSDFEEFGRVRFQNAPFDTRGGIQNITTVLLNEEQYFLLMTYQRNTKKVREFKINATKAFFAMKKKLYGTSTPAALPAPELSDIKEEIKLLREEQEEIRHIMSEDTEGIRRMTHLARTATIACNSMADHLADMPMDKGQLSVLRMSVESRGAELAKQLGISRESGIAGVFRVLNRHFEVGSYHEISRAEFYRATLFVKTAEL